VEAALRVKLTVQNIKGGTVRRIDVRDDVFDAPPNKALVHQVTVGQLANLRQGTAETKTRGNVSGGGRKPRPQKGTGSARAGSIRSPIWKGGGVVFGPHPRSYRQRTPKRMRRLALLSVLSDKVRDGELVVLDSFALEEARTAEMAEVLGALDATSSVLLVVDGSDQGALAASRNIKKLKTLPANLLNALDLMNHRKVIMTVEAVRKAEEIWGGARHSRRDRADAVA
jgi:large subunit ribosomal protein L4